MTFKYLSDTINIIGERMKLAVKITYDFDEDEFVCFVERLKIEGRGQTEQEAIDNFQIQLDKNFGGE